MEMRKRFYDWFWRGVAICGVLLPIYVASYLIIIQRQEVTSVVPHPTPEGELSRKSVNGVGRWGSVGGWIGYALFRPANKFDRAYVRSRYWSDYSILVTPTGTNVLYEYDRKQQWQRVR